MFRNFKRDGFLSILENKTIEQGKNARYRNAFKSNFSMVFSFSYAVEKTVITY